MNAIRASAIAGAFSFVVDGNRIRSGGMSASTARARYAYICSSCTGRRA